MSYLKQLYQINYIIINGNTKYKNEYPQNHS